jgi:hypothetical protein
LNANATAEIVSPDGDTDKRNALKGGACLRIKQIIPRINHLAERWQNQPYTRRNGADYGQFAK